MAIEPGISVVLGSLVNLDAHPITELENESGKAFIGRCQTSLASQGFVRLPGFLRPEGAARLAEEALALEREPSRSAGFYSTETHNVYLREESAADSESHERHPARVQQTSSKLLFAADELGERSALRALYTWPPLLAFVRAALGLSSLHLSADPMGR